MPAVSEIDTVLAYMYASEEQDGDAFMYFLGHRPEYSCMRCSGK